MELSANPEAFVSKEGLVVWLEDRWMELSCDLFSAM